MTRINSLRFILHDCLNTVGLLSDYSPGLWYVMCSVHLSLVVENILSGFRKPEIVDKPMDENSNDSDTELLTPELAALFNSDTEDEEFDVFADDS